MKILQTALLTLLLLSPLAAEDFATLKRVNHTKTEDTLKLELETSNSKPEVSVFFASGPERLIVEFNDTQSSLKLGRKPAIRMVKSWSVKPFGLNRCRLTLVLNHRPPSSSLKVKERQGGLSVEFATTPGVKEKVALTEGITWLREDTYMGGRWTRLNRLLFDPEDPNLEVVVGLANEKLDAREPLTKMVRRYKAVAGINGGFFAGRGGPLGLVYRDGRMVMPHVSRRPPRSGFGLTTDGKPLFGRIAATGPKIKDLDGGDWSKAVMALGGGPRLVKDGLAKITADLEELGPKGNDITRVAARTVVGLNSRGKLLFCTVTGYRDNHSQGTKFGPLVGWLKGLGVKEAVNFDGGASVDMVIGSHIVSDGPGNRTKEKPVATAFLLKDKRPTRFPNSARWTFGKKRLHADGSSSTTLEVALRDSSGKPVPDGTPVRFFSRGVALSPADLKTEGGKVKAKINSIRRPGKAKIILMSGPLREEKAVALTAGKISKLHVAETGAKALEDEEGWQTVTIKVQTVDKWGNPVAKQKIGCTVDGSEVVEFLTDKMGMMALDVELPMMGGEFTVTHPAAGTVRHRIGPLQSATSKLIGTN